VEIAKENAVKKKKSRGVLDSLSREQIRETAKLAEIYNATNGYQDDDIDWWSWIGKGIGILFVVAIGLSIICSDGGSGTDGVYESGMEKMNKGQPLNDVERKRMNDLINGN
jgi:hypothetical protein